MSKKDMKAKRKMLEEKYGKYREDSDSGMGKAMGVSVMAKDKKGLKKGLAMASKMAGSGMSAKNGGYKDPKMGQKSPDDSSSPDSDGIARRSVKYSSDSAKGKQKPFGKDYDDGGLGGDADKLKPKKKKMDKGRSYADGGLGGDARKLSPKQRKMMELRNKKGI